MILRLTRTDGRQSPPVAESVEVSESGEFNGWRSVAAAVGSFSGTLPEADLTTWRALSAATADADPGSHPRMPGGSTETLELPGRDPVLLSDAEAAGGSWTELAGLAQSLLERLPEHPRAAIGLSVDTGSPQGLAARLEHRGEDSLTLDLSAVEVSVAVWKGYYEPAGDWSGVVAGPERVAAGPGWSFPLPLEVEPPPGADITLHVTAGFRMVFDGGALPVQATYLPEIPQP